ncbi:MAG TPA: hypothetical protein VGF88_01580 [Acidobacteriaceae bacterium]|jgi:hypothetical protein
MKKASNKSGAKKSPTAALRGNDKPLPLTPAGRRVSEVRIKAGKPVKEPHTL